MSIKDKYRGHRPPPAANLGLKARFNHRRKMIPGPGRRARDFTGMVLWDGVVRVVGRADHDYGYAHTFWTCEWLVGEPGTFVVPASTIKCHLSQGTSLPRRVYPSVAAYLADHPRASFSPTLISAKCATQRVRSKAYRKHNGPAYDEVDMDPRWLEHSPDGYVNMERDLGKRPSRAYTVDRLDPARGYWKDNCRWATGYQQARNKEDAELALFPGGVVERVEPGKPLPVDVVEYLGRLGEVIRTHPRHVRAYQLREEGQPPIPWTEVEL